MSDTSAGNDLESLLTTPNLVATGLVLISLLLLITIFRGRGRRSQRDKEWDIQRLLGESAMTRGTLPHSQMCLHPTYNTNSNRHALPEQQIVLNVKKTEESSMFHRCQ